MKTLFRFLKAFRLPIFALVVIVVMLVLGYLVTTGITWVLFLLFAKATGTAVTWNLWASSGILYIALWLFVGGGSKK